MPWKWFKGLLNKVRDDECEGRLCSVWVVTFCHHVNCVFEHVRQSTKSVFVCTRLCTVCALCSALDLFVPVHGEYDQPIVLGGGLFVGLRFVCVFG